MFTAQNVVLTTGVGIVAFVILAVWFAAWYFGRRDAKRWLATPRYPTGRRINPGDAVTLSDPWLGTGTVEEIREDGRVRVIHDYLGVVYLVPAGAVAYLYPD